MAEAFKTDAICVGDDQMVMKGDSHDRQRLFYITCDRNIRA